MDYTKVSLNEAEVTFDANDNVLDAVKSAVSMAEADGLVWNLMLILTTDQWSPHRTELQERGFVPAGFLSKGTQTRIKLKLNVRRSGDGGHASGRDVDLAVSAPTLPPTPEENAAILELFQRHPEYAVIWKKFTEQVRTGSVELSQEAA